MNLNLLAVIFQAEFLRKVRSRPFIIGTLLGIVGIFAFTSLPALLAHVFSSGGKNLVLIGEPALTNAAAELVRDDYTIVAQERAIEGTPTIAFLDDHGKAAGAVTLVRDAKGIHGTAYLRDAGSWSSTFAHDIAPLNVAYATNVSPARISGLLRVPIATKSLDAKFTDERSANTARGVAYLLVFMLYLSIILNAQAVMASVAEEKTSRIAELLVATVSPAQLLAGKIFAAGSAGAIQLGLWAATGIYTGQQMIAFFSAGPSTGASAATPTIGAIPITTVQGIAFVLFFIVGFVQYSTMYAAAASLINRTEDLGSVTIPLVIPVVVGFMLAQFAIAEPHSQGVAIVSQVPLLAPFVMFTRIAVATVPLWEIALSLAINIAATVGIVWAAGKVYRVGLLMYGKMPSLRQIVATVRA
jgi:ABC-2 type transport system permease protein